MPIFDFICTNEECKHEIKDLVIPFNSDSVIQCPKCGHETKRQVPLVGSQKQNWSKWRVLMGD